MSTAPRKRPASTATAPRLTAESDTPAISLDRRIRRTRKAVCLSLQELLHTTPLDQITIREIAEKADVSYTTFFRHYPDKETVLAALADDEINRLLDLCMPLISGPTIKSGSDACLATCRYVHKDRILWSALLTGGAATSIRATFIQRTFERATKLPLSHEWLPRDVMTTVSVGVTFDILAWWLSQSEDSSPEEIAAILDKLLVSLIQRKKR
jgi:AcrR family transcriptional regulator